MHRFIGVAFVLVFVSGPLGADALREAAEALARNDYAAAIPHLETALRDDPGNFNARFNLAYAYQESGDAEGAIGHYRRIVSEQPELVPARSNLAALLLRAERYAEAAGELAEIAAARPGDVGAQLAVAAALRQAGDLEAAVRAYRESVALDGTSLEALTGLAGTLDELGRLAEAEPYYRRAADQDPALEARLLDVADRLERAGSRREALALYRRFAERRPGNAEIQERIGHLLLEAGDARAAADSLERALAIEATADRHSALAEAYRQAGEADSARKHLQLAAEAAPGNARLRVRHANALLQIQDFERAAREYLAACEADPLARDAWNGLAFAMFQLENFQAALRALGHAESLGAPLPASVYLKALALDKLGLYDEAQAAYQAFLGADPGMQDEEWKATQRLKAIAKVLAKR